MSLPDLPPPSGSDDTPRGLVSELGALVGDERAAGWCADLLAGGDPHDFVPMLPYLGKNCAAAAFDPAWHDYWHRTWGGRGLLYVWTDSAAPVVVAGLGDEHWRPAEMLSLLVMKPSLRAWLRRKSVPRRTFLPYSP